MKNRIVLVCTLLISATTFAQVRPVQNKQLEKGTAPNQVLITDANLVGVWQASPFAKLSDTASTLASKHQLNLVAASVPNNGTFSNGVATISSPNGSSFQIAMSNYWVPLSQKAAANGVASLGADGKVPASQLPAQNVSDVFVVSSRAAMLALSTADKGDFAVRTDSSITYVLQQGPPSNPDNWILLPQATGVMSVNGKSGANVTLNTDDVSEGATNKYFSLTAARAAIQGSTTVSYNNATGVISLPNSGVAAGTYNNVTLDATGRATSASNVAYLQASALNPYYTQTQLQTAGQAQVHFQNITNVPANISLSMERQESTGTASSTITLNYTPKFPAAVDVKFNGLSLHSADYSISGTTLTLGIARTSSDYITIIYAR